VEQTALDGAVATFTALKIMLLLQSLKLIQH
jgi:hypothetical protein